MNEDLAAAVANARFRPVRLKEGYLMGDVDTFLDELTDALLSGRSVLDLIDHTEFETAKWRETYSRDDVDRLLARVRAEARTA